MALQHLHAGGDGPVLAEATVRRRMVRSIDRVLRCRCPQMQGLAGADGAAWRLDTPIPATHVFVALLVDGDAPAVCDWWLPRPEFNPPVRKHSHQCQLTVHRTDADPTPATTTPTLWMLAPQRIKGVATF